ncbi:PA14 domain-containing protein [Paenibacillus allorhizosphaerae]|uniref:PA14 domain-containing protein n=1 Tax=Paenibacillus allorhizosphaerae TaxID=2849866 RepID=A0ABM8VEW6_9BACL|nr:PA14 domain-containing protein [Paenibacillus allorhizosphaerae]CAG7632606.1 hypothetical protein PAECIP111802_01862 [Paenibacillus allorhizosphaerae]
MKRFVPLVLTFALLASTCITGIGLFRDGTAATVSAAPLERPYTDWRQQEIQFGTRSFYSAPWRAYMDTWDSGRFLETLGINFNVTAQEADATAKVLADSGIRSARVEFNWGNLSFDDETQFIPQQGQNLTKILTALRDNNIRPLLLLNANSGGPAPYKQFMLKLSRSAKAGDREIYLESTEGIRPGYTGLIGMAYQTMYPIITWVDPATGRCELSAPLPKDIPMGAVTLVQLKYQPISGTTFADGTVNPAAEETLKGWMNYVKTVTDFAKKVLGTANAPDAGFDLEVWNEWTFGSQFLDINNYYNPPLTFATQLSYTEGNQTITGYEVLLPKTAQYVAQPENKLPGVRVISGFSNQRPWENGKMMWTGQAGFSRHPYTGYAHVNETTYPKNVTYNATGTIDQEHYVPDHVIYFPERWFYAYQTEFVVRDIQPFPGPWSDHYRYSNPGNGKPAEVWMSETNLNRLNFAQDLMAAAKVDAKNENLIRVMHQMGMKALLRMFTFYSHKGIKTAEIFAAKGGDLSYGVLPDAFFEELKKSNYILTPAVREKVGPGLATLSNAVRLMKTGTAIDLPRPLKVESLNEPEPRLVFKGDGTAEHPDVYHRDDFAVLPFQLDSNKFAVGYYDITRDMTYTWDSTKDILDSTRYDMPPETFEMTLSNVRGTNAKVYAYDPVTDKNVPVQLVRSTTTTLTVQVETMDYPRFLMIEEAGKGPLITRPKLVKTPTEAVFSFIPNVSGKVSISWGPYPVRSTGTFKEESFPHNEFTKAPLSTRDVQLIDFSKASGEIAPRKGSWRWTGTIVPKYSEDYTFLIETDGCKMELYIDGTNIVKACGQPTKGTISLKAGKSYDLILKYTNDYATPHNVSLYWASASQPRELVAPDSKGKNQLKANVQGNLAGVLTLPNLKNGEGVKMEFESEGIIIRYPQWNYDVQGVLWP